MTVVGDIAQTGALAGVSRWRDVFAPHVANRWNLSELTVNYRTPAQIMDVVSRVMAASPIEVSVPDSARQGTDEPCFTRVSGPVERADELLEAVRQEIEAVGDGTVVVITPRALHTRQHAYRSGLAVRCRQRVPRRWMPRFRATVAGGEGLEFDSVVLVELSDSRRIRGYNDLYVAMTRPTKRLHSARCGPSRRG